MGPLTRGFERWANLPPSQDDLQSFGYAEVNEEGVLDIKLMGITGEVMWAQNMTPVEASGKKKKKPKKKGPPKCVKAEKGKKRTLRA